LVLALVNASENQTRFGGSASLDPDLGAAPYRCQIANYHPKPAWSDRSEQQGRQGQYYVLKNTKQKTYLRLSAIEYGLWNRMDGQRRSRSDR
jgi:hypothetical protein